jgi:hypothetical protein
MNRIAISLLLLSLNTLAHTQDSGPVRNVQEDVYVHMSKTDLIVGETINFSAYVYSRETGKLSPLSSILYLELIDMHGAPVYQTKIALTDGLGFGEYFVSSVLSTGTYQVVAYTRWMKNFGSYFRQPVIIVNPYEKPIIAEPITRKLALNFYPEGGAILPGQKNKIVVTSNQTETNTIGRIVSDNGNKVADFTIDESGFGVINLTADSNKSYRAIIDSETGFAFFDLPVVCGSCIKLRVTTIPNEFAIFTVGDQTLSDSQGTLEISNTQNTVFSREVKLNSSVSILKNTLPSGLLLISYTNGDLKSERLIYNGAMEANIRETGASYKTREKAVVPIELPLGTNYSISVSRLYNQINQIQFGVGYKLNAAIDRQQTTDFYKNATTEVIDLLLITSKWRYANSALENIQYLPETRSDLIKGYVTSDSDKPLLNLQVSLAVSGTNYHVSVAETNSDGKFLMNFETPTENFDGYASVLFDTAKNYKVSLSNEFYNTYPPFPSAPLVFDTARVESLIARSISNQLDNAYYVANQSADTTRQDHISQINNFVTYRLDDYTRFRTIRDTFIEYIAEAGISKNESIYRFDMKGNLLEYGPDAIGKTLLLLDGIPVSAEEILEYSPFLIEYIDIINRMYYFGPAMVNGVIAFRTYNNNLEGFKSKSGKNKLVGIPAQSMDIASPTLAVKMDSRLPDYREIIYWHPQLIMESDELNFECYTSDIQGTYELRVEGVTRDGEPVSMVKYFNVE